MERNWLLGFLESQGCFCIVIKRNKKYRQVCPNFSMKLGKLDRVLLEKIQAELGGIGNIYTEQNSVTLKVTKLEEIENLISILDWMDFQSERKRTEFDIWKKCVDIIRRKEHLKKDGFLKIAMLRELAGRKNISNKINFCGIHNEIEPCPEFRKKRRIPKNCSKCF